MSKLKTAMMSGVASAALLVTTLAASAQNLSAQKQNQKLTYKTHVNNREKLNTVEVDETIAQVLNASETEASTTEYSTDGKTVETITIRGRLKNDQNFTMDFRSPGKNGSLHAEDLLTANLEKNTVSGRNHTLQNIYLETGNPLNESDDFVQMRSDKVNYDLYMSGNQYVQKNNISVNNWIVSLKNKAILAKTTARLLMQNIVAISKNEKDFEDLEIHLPGMVHGATIPSEQNQTLTYYEVQKTGNDANNFEKAIPKKIEIEDDLADLFKNMGVGKTYTEQGDGIIAITNRFSQPDNDPNNTSVTLLFSEPRHGQALSISDLHYMELEKVTTVDGKSTNNTISIDRNMDRPFVRLGTLSKDDKSYEIKWEGELGNKVYTDKAIGTFIGQLNELSAGNTSFDAINDVMFEKFSGTKTTTQFKTGATDISKGVHKLPSRQHRHHHVRKKNNQYKHN